MKESKAIQNNLKQDGYLSFSGVSHEVLMDPAFSPFLSLGDSKCAARSEIFPLKGLNASTYDLPMI